MLIFKRSLVVFSLLVILWWLLYLINGDHNNIVAIEHDGEVVRSEQEELVHLMDV